MQLLQLKAVQDIDVDDAVSRASLLDAIPDAHPVIGLRRTDIGDGARGCGRQPKHIALIEGVGVQRLQQASGDDEPGAVVADALRHHTNGGGRVGVAIRLRQVHLELGTGRPTLPHHLPLGEGGAGLVVNLYVQVHPQMGRHVGVKA